MIPGQNPGFFLFIEIFKQMPHIFGKKSTTKNNTREIRKQ